MLLLFLCYLVSNGPGTKKIRKNEAVKEIKLVGSTHLNVNECDARIANVDQIVSVVVAVVVIVVVSYVNV